MEELRKFEHYLEDRGHEDRESRQEEHKDTGDSLLPGGKTQNQSINNPQNHERHSCFYNDTLIHRIKFTRDYIVSITYAHCKLVFVQGMSQIPVQGSQSLALIFKSSKCFGFFFCFCFFF